MYCERLHWRCEALKIYISNTTPGSRTVSEVAGSCRSFGFAVFAAKETRVVPYVPAAFRKEIHIESETLHRSYSDIESAGITVSVEAIDVSGYRFTRSHNADGAQRQIEGGMPSIDAGMEELIGNKILEENRLPKQPMENPSRCLVLQGRPNFHRQKELYRTITKLRDSARKATKQNSSLRLRIKYMGKLIREPTFEMIAELPATSQNFLQSYFRNLKRNKHCHSGYERRPQIANHATVWMLKGVQDIYLRAQIIYF